MLQRDERMRESDETILDKPVAEISYGHDSNADALLVRFSDGTQLAVVLRPPARLRDARAMYFREGGEVALTLEDLLRLSPRPD